MTDEPPTLPDGDYAIVECLGHRTIVGRVEEIERFGTKLISIEPIFKGQLLAAVLLSGASLYQFTPCSKDVAARQAPKEMYQLPSSVRVTMPVALLTSPEPELEEADIDFEPPSFLQGS